MDKELLASVISQIFGLATILGTLWIKKSLSSGINGVSGSIESLQSQIKSIQTELAIHVERDEVKVHIIATLENVIIQKIKFSNYLKPCHHEVLSCWGVEFSKFATNAYFSNFRKSKDKELFYNDNKQKLISSLSLMFVQRLDYNSDDVDLLFKREQKINYTLGSLVETLIRNGLDSEGYVNLFEKTLFNISDEIIRLITLKN